MKEQDAHTYFSANCFNGVWDLLEKEGRSTEEDKLMLEMAHASLYHWMQRDDREDGNISIGLWQVSRVYAVLGRTVEAARYAADCIELSKSRSLSPFHLAYAYEAAARAAKIEGNSDACRGYLDSVRSLLEEIDDAESRKLLEADIEDVESGLS